ARRESDMEARVAPGSVHLWDDPDWYPIHEEDNVPEIIVHYDAADYVGGVLSAHVPDGWVTGDVCCYWTRGDTRNYLAPDVFLVDGVRPEPPPSSFLSWLNAPMRLAVELGSR